MDKLERVLENVVDRLLRSSDGTLTAVLYKGTPEQSCARRLPGSVILRTLFDTVS